MKVAERSRGALLPFKQKTAFTEALQGQHGYKYIFNKSRSRPCRAPITTPIPQGVALGLGLDTPVGAWLC